MKSHIILALYRTLTETAQHMLVAASTSEWNRFIDLAGLSADITTLLHEEDVDVALTEQESAQKRGFIERYLDCDKRIRDTIAPHMAMLATIVNATTKSNVIQNLYAKTP